MSPGCCLWPHKGFSVFSLPRRQPGWQEGPELGAPGPRLVRLWLTGCPEGRPCSEQCVLGNLQLLPSRLLAGIPRGLFPTFSGGTWLNSWRLTSQHLGGLWVPVLRDPSSAWACAQALPEPLVTAHYSLGSQPVLACFQVPCRKPGLRAVLPGSPVLGTAVCPVSLSVVDPRGRFGFTIQLTVCRWGAAATPKPLVRDGNRSTPLASHG